MRTNIEWVSPLGLFAVLGVACASACAASGTTGTGEPNGTENSGTNTSSGSGSDDGGNGGSNGGGGNENGSSGVSSGSNQGGSGNSSSAASSGASSSGSSSHTGSSASGGGASTSSSSGASSAGPSPTMLPAISGTCPTIAAGANGTALTFAGEPVNVFTGSGGGGPLVMYWYPTGGSEANAVELLDSEFGQTNISAVTGEGGMVVAFGTSNGQGTDTGDGVWFTGDFTTADQVVACAISQLHIDTSRIFVTGASAGGLQTTWMSYARSGYVAAAVTLSGGLEEVGGFSGTPTTLQDPTNVPSVMAVHGAEGSDVVVIDFAVASAAWEADIATKHGFSMDCNTGGGHVSGPPQILPGMWQFMVDHPFKVSPQPYPPIPAVYPSYCEIGPRAADGGVP